MELPISDNGSTLFATPALTMEPGIPQTTLVASSWAISNWYTRGPLLYCVKKVISSPLKGGVRALPIWDDIFAIGEILSVFPPDGAISGTTGDSTIEILFGSESTLPQTDSIIFEQLFRVTKVHAPLQREETIEKQPRILVVEDEFISSKVAVRMLEKFGRCEYVADASEALVAFTVALEEGNRFDLVFLDIDLPDMDGQKLLRLLKKIEGGRHIKCSDSSKAIMLTGANDSKSILTSFKDGCEAYLVKPLDKAKLVETLSKLGFVQKDPPPPTP